MEVYHHENCMFNDGDIIKLYGYCSSSLYIGQYHTPLLLSIAWGTRKKEYSAPLVPLWNLELEP